MIEVIIILIVAGTVYSAIIGINEKGYAKQH